MWGYKPIPGAKTPDDEKKTLDAWAREQDKTPWLRFSTADSRGSDPGELTEAVGDADAVKATDARASRTSSASPTCCSRPRPRRVRTGDDLAELYGRTLGQWAIELNHVVVDRRRARSRSRSTAGRTASASRPIPVARQAEAVKFLNENAFATPTFLLKPEILRRIEPNGALDRVRTAQGSVLTNLLSPTRVARMVELERHRRRRGLPADHVPRRRAQGDLV